MNDWPRGNNQFSRRLEAVEQARKKWEESEWVLRKLRSRASNKTQMIDDETLIEWHQRIAESMYQPQ